MTAKTHVDNKHVSLSQSVSDDPSCSDSDEMEIGQDESSGESEGEGETKGDNPSGLANVMARILNNKVPNEKKTILAKALTEREIRKKKVRKEQGSDTEEKTVAIVEKKKLWEDMCRVKPQPLDRDRERRLQKIATRGVVQLFNAVKKQQKTLEEKLNSAGSSERRRDKVMESVNKGAFLDLLKGTRPNVSKDSVNRDTAKRKNKLQSTTEDVGEESKWNILREDFMMGATLKDWDKDSSGGEDNDNDNNTVDDSDSE